MGGDRHPAEEAADETLDGFARRLSGHKMSVVRRAVRLMESRWKNHAGGPNEASSIPARREDAEMLPMHEEAASGEISGHEYRVIIPVCGPSVMVTFCGDNDNDQEMFSFRYEDMVSAALAESDRAGGSGGE